MHPGFTGLIFALLFFIALPVSAVVPGPLPSSVATVVCTPPPCPPGGSLECPPPGNNCTGGCGIVCVTPTIVCTPPPCPPGGTLTCPPAVNGCPGGCGVVCQTPATPKSSGEPLVLIGGIALCLFVLRRRSS